MAKLQKLNDLTKTLELLKSITEKTEADFTANLFCHGICNEFMITINPTGWNINRNEIRLSIDLEGNSDNIEVLAKLAYFAEYGFEKHPDFILAEEKAKAIRLAEFTKLKAEFEKESEVKNA